ncbi:hypothetical protein ACP3VS_24155 [Lysinibacillus sp. VIII_CA]
MKWIKLIIIILIIAIAINLFMWFGLKSQNPENIKDNDIIEEKEN